MVATEAQANPSAVNQNRVQDLADKWFLGFKTKSSLLSLCDTKSYIAEGKLNFWWSNKTSPCSEDRFGRR